MVIEGDHKGGMILDFNDLKAHTREVLQQYDNRHWNDVLDFPTVADQVSAGDPRVGRQRQMGGVVSPAL